MFEIGFFASTSLSVLQTPVNKAGGKLPSLGVRQRQSIQLKLRLRRDLNVKNISEAANRRVAGMTMSGVNRVIRLMAMFEVAAEPRVLRMVCPEIPAVKI
jgi:hypothetical protein